jgi:hypothetical protein
MKRLQTMKGEYCNIKILLMICSVFIGPSLHARRSPDKKVQKPPELSKKAKKKPIGLTQQWDSKLTKKVQKMIEQEGGSVAEVLQSAKQQADDLRMQAESSAAEIEETTGQVIDDLQQKTEEHVGQLYEHAEQEVLRIYNKAEEQSAKLASKAREEIVKIKGDAEHQAVILINKAEQEALARKYGTQVVDQKVDQVVVPPIESREPDVTQPTSHAWKEAVKHDFEGDVSYLKGIILEGETDHEQRRDFEKLFSDQKVWFDTTVSSTTYFFDPQYNAVMRKKHEFDRLVQAQKDAEAMVEHMTGSYELSEAVQKKLRLVTLYELNTVMQKEGLARRQDVRDEQIQNIVTRVLQEAKLDQLLAKPEEEIEAEEIPEPHIEVEKDVEVPSEPIEVPKAFEPLPQALRTLQERVYALEAQLRAERLRLDQLQIDAQVSADEQVKDLLAEKALTLSLSKGMSALRKTHTHQLEEANKKSIECAVELARTQTKSALQQQQAEYEVKRQLRPVLEHERENVLKLKVELAKARRNAQYLSNKFSTLSRKQNRLRKKLEERKEALQSRLDKRTKIAEKLKDDLARAQQEVRKIQKKMNQERKKAQQLVEKSKKQTLQLHVDFHKTEDKVQQLQDQMTKLMDQNMKANQMVIQAFAQLQKVSESARKKVERKNEENIELEVALRKAQEKKESLESQIKENKKEITQIAQQAEQEIADLKGRYEQRIVQFEREKEFLHEQQFKEQEKRFTLMEQMKEELEEALDQMDKNLKQIQEQFEGQAEELVRKEEELKTWQEELERTEDYARKEIEKIMKGDDIEEITTEVAEKITEDFDKLLDEFQDATEEGRAQELDDMVRKERKRERERLTKPKEA